MVNICNQPEICNILFKNKFNGKVYGSEHAQGLFKIAKEGWQVKNYIFAIIDTNGNICGMLDIKDVNREGSEVGYWASNQHNGIMTKALELMINWAREQGYLTLFARVRKDNFRSQNVLSRNGFTNAGDFPLEEDGIPRFKFVKKL